MDQLHLGLIERVMRWAAVALVAAGGGLLLASPRAAAGVALGGTLSLGLLALHRTLAAGWLRSRRRRAARIVFWAIWLTKWLVLGALLYCSLSRGWVSAGWVCAGIGMVPAAATALALRALLLDGWREIQAAGAKP